MGLGRGWAYGVWGLRVWGQGLTKIDYFNLIPEALFLAAKRNSTPALVIVSVRPSVSKQNFSLFGQLMTTYDNL